MLWLFLAVALLVVNYWPRLAILAFICSCFLAYQQHILTSISGLILLIIVLVILLRHGLIIASKSSLTPDGQLVTPSASYKIMLLSTEIVLVLAALALITHKLPGFNNPKVLDNVQAGPLSTTLTLYFNFDKGLIPLILISCLPSLFNSLSSHPSRSKWQWCLLLVSPLLLLLLAVQLGGLTFERHFPHWLGLFIFSNIFLVSLAEEAFFRGYLQQRLTQLFDPYTALILASLAFGFLHYYFSANLLLLIFTTLAGLIYGTMWLFSGKLWWCVAIHVMLNLLQLFFFTYPMLAHHH